MRIFRLVCGTIYVADCLVLININVVYQKMYDFFDLIDIAYYCTRIFKLYPAKEIQIECSQLWTTNNRTNTMNNN